MSFAKLSMLACLFSLSYLSCAASTVGTCQSDKHSYSTITNAIAAAPDGGVIEVCAGTYPEQLIIKKPITLRGLGSFTLSNPEGGLLSLAASGNGSSSVFTPVFIDVPKGEVKISYMGTAGGDIAFPQGNPVPAYALCQSGVIDAAYGGSYVGIYSANGNVVLDHIETGFDIDPVPPGTGRSSWENPNCGDGIIFGAGVGVVQDSIIGFGHFGISGASKVEHSTVTGGGPHSVAISSYEVEDSTVSGPGFFYTDSIGLYSSNSRGNVVQAWTTGIKRGTSRHNTLLNNEVAISDANDLAENLIVAPGTYPNPLCVPGVICTDENPNSPIQKNLPTIGIDMGCSDGTVTRDNSIVSVGIGFANVDPVKSIPKSNLLANVPVTSTACAK